MFFLLWAYLFASMLIAEGEGSLRMPKEMAESELLDKAGAHLPLDVEITNQDGRKIKLASYFSAEDQRPLILTLGYYGCPMLCSLVLNGLVESLKKLSFQPGDDYRLISVSIDDRETYQLAKQKQIAYLGALAQSDEKVWQFHVANAAEVKRLADAVGFNYIFDQRDNQFVHGAGFFVISPSGVLSRTLFGISFNPSDIKLALTEAAQGKIGSFVDRVLLSCFHYDPDSHRYGIYILGVMRLGGIITILTLGMVLLMYFRAERKRMKSMA